MKNDKNKSVSSKYIKQNNPEQPATEPTQDRPEKPIPVTPETNPDPTKPAPGGNEPEKIDPTRIEEPPNKVWTQFYQPTTLLPQYGMWSNEK